MFVDVTAGPVVVSTDSDYDNIHNTIPYEYAYGTPRLDLSYVDQAMKINTIALLSKNILRNILFPNVMNMTYIPAQRQLVLPIVFFTNEDPYSPRVSSLMDEIEEVKEHVRVIFKTHLKTRRVHIVTDTVYLPNNISLTNSIRSTFIDSINLVNQNNSIQYHVYRRIVRFSVLSYE